jgi:hypothetical protein
LVVFVLVLLSDVLGVEVFLLAPTSSDGDGAGPRYCAPLPPSPPRLRGIPLKTRMKRQFCWKKNIFFVGTLN